jgi:hypothetical protein
MIEPWHAEAMNIVLKESGLSLKQQLRFRQLFSEFPLDTRRFLKAFNGVIGPHPWRWPWFDDWRQKFRQAQAWPLVWRDIADLDMDLNHPNAGADLEKMLSRFEYETLKELIRRMDAPKPVPRTRIGIQDWLLANSNWTVIKLVLDDIQAEQQAEAAKEEDGFEEASEDRTDQDVVAETQVDLLYHSVCSTGYHLKTMAHACELGSSREIWRVKLTVFQDCQIEATIAAQHADAVSRWRVGQPFPPLPPFFPGDRTSINLVNPYKKA